MDRRKFVFLDRDGTIIKDKCYMSDPGDLEFIKGSVEALKRLQETFSLVVVTNQSGIGRGRFKHDDYATFNRRFLRSLEDLGIKVEATLYCPHDPDEGCDCRKPKTKLVDDWLSAEGIILDRDNSFVVGDKMSDVELGKNLGVKSILISNKARDASSDYLVAKDIKEATEIILC